MTDLTDKINIDAPGKDNHGHHPGRLPDFLRRLARARCLPLSHWERVELRVVDTFCLQAVDAAARFGGALMIRVVEPQPNGIDSAAL
jgi:hypothetical protein